MNIQRVALIFDDETRPETTGVYCRRALGGLVEVKHFRPTELEHIPKCGFELYLNIDDGLRYHLPGDLRPSAWWAIDTHLDFDWCLAKARGFDCVFAAQRDGANRLGKEGVAAVWLPLACDPEIHRKHEIEKVFDVCFVGNLIPGERAELIDLLQRRFRNTFVGQRYFDEMAQIYSRSRIVFNRSIRNDINMRVFEGLATGSLVMTNDLRDNGQDELFVDGRHLATYRDADELVDKVAYYLKREELRERIAGAGREEAVARHTYRQRMSDLLVAVETALSRRMLAVGDEVKVNGVGEDCTGGGLNSDEFSYEREEYDPFYFDFVRPEILAFIPASARRVLDIGCGAGRLGEALKARQPAEVTGIEMVEAAAKAAHGRLDRVLWGDVERMELPFGRGSFDAVVCGDVLEHLEAPERLLACIREWLAPGGALVASIPNVRHHSVVQSLLDGNWTYEAAGLLDRTHMRFFTRREIEEVLQRSGFMLVQLGRVPGPGYQEWEQQGRPGAVKTGRLSIGGLRAEEAEEFYVYQYLVVAQPAGNGKAPEESSEEAIAARAAHNGVGALGCVLAVRDRPVEYLERTLQTYAYQSLQPVDRVLLDYGSDASVSEAYAVVCRRYGWRLVRHKPTTAGWSLSAAYNAAVEALSGEVKVVFKSDIDVLLGQDVLETAATLGRDQLCLFSCLTTQEGTVYPAPITSHRDLLELLKAPTPLQEMLGEGVHAYPKTWFEEIGGFDLNFSGWGFEDSDLRERARRSIGYRNVANTLLIHQWHARAEESASAARNRAYYDRMKTSRQVVRNGGRLLASRRGSQPASGPRAKQRIRVAVATRSMNDLLFETSGELLGLDSLGAETGLEWQRHRLTGTAGLDYFRNLVAIDADWVINIDEDAFVLNPAGVIEVVRYMTEGGYAACGMPDGGVVAIRRHNPVACNAFFNVFDMRLIRSVWSNWQRVVEAKHKAEYERLVPEFAKRTAFAFDHFEQYYGVFFSLLEFGQRILYLDAEEWEDGVSTVLKGPRGEPLLLHCWYSRQWETSELTRLRYTRAIQYARQCQGLME
jgi:2-polyprenyl-3-methyl-5-hydroxy-6-metoxy-1,4-benzoquinol methylase